MNQKSSEGINKPQEDILFSLVGILLPLTAFDVRGFEPFGYGSFGTPPFVFGIHEILPIMV